MGEKLNEDVKNWFQTQTWEVAPPRTNPPLEGVMGRRDGESALEEAVRGRALRARGLPMPPQELVEWVGGGDAHVFHTVGLLNAWQVMVYCRLQPSSRVLEPGCGCGRNARFLAPYLDPASGRYEGFDIHRASIDWASTHISSVYSNVRFGFADIQNTNYNPAGATPSSRYVFPYESNSFDVVFLPSVFTHLTRGGFEQYVREIARVLAADGVLLSWHFLLDDVSRELVRDGRSVLALERYDEVSWAMDSANPCAAIAFDEPYVLECLEGAGLRPQFIAHGRWSGRTPDGLFDAQDRILAVRARTG